MQRKSPTSIAIAPATLSAFETNSFPLFESPFTRALCSTVPINIRTLSAIQKRRRRRRVPAAQLGPWSLTQRVAQGTCTNLFVARPTDAQEESPCDYVVKALRDEFADDPLAIDTIKREAHAGTVTRHPHLITVLADHSHAAPHYVVLPRLFGATVRQALDDVGAVTIPQSLWIARQVAEALDAIHQQGMIHCDVKPSNLFVAVSGHATLFDLGYACEYENNRHTATNVLRGTMAYLAPEMLTSSTAAGPWSDVYSLGVTLFEMLTGQLPFNHTSTARMAESHLREVPPSARTYVPNLPRPVAQLIERMLSKHPARRPDDIVEQLRRLEIETFGLRAA